ncbi:MAG: methyltransferase [Acidobacteria bacterium]|nr:methyltransferase [Acidobacteriota bacterium]
MSPEPSSDHYSYAAYADPAMARSFDQRRFSGPIGELIATAQARVLANMVGRIQDREVLDVGTGTGRAALILAAGGAKVTAVDASEEMLAIARQRAAEQLLTAIAFQRGDAHNLDFADRSFDAVVSFRMLMHTPQWKRCVAELCRVAERLVIVDYPSATSVALFESLARGVMHSAGRKTEPYRVFTRRAIREAFERNGFRIRSVHRQFVLPIALHKAIGSRRFTTATERLLDHAGLLKAFGSPVTLVAERCAS